ncbi:endonuclease 4 [Streptomyces purpurascens]
MHQTLDLLVDTVGEGRLKLIHANDSKDVVGAHKDRHGTSAWATSARTPSGP